MSSLKRISLTSIILGLITFSDLLFSNENFNKETLRQLNDPKIEETITPKYAEKIDDQLYAPDTIKKIEELNTDTQNKLNDPKIREVLRPKIDALFNRMESNVDSYLDWFYRIGSDYQKVFDSLTGALETKMKVKLQKELYKNTDQEVKDLIDVINLQIHDKDNLENERVEKLINILNKNLLSNPTTNLQILDSLILEDSFRTPNYFLNIKNLTENITIEIGSTIAKKMLIKGPFKSATRTISKWFIKNTSTLIDSAAIGATAGSFIPIVGTITGGALTVLTDLFINHASLKIEEFTDRDDIKKSIIKNIHDSKEEFINKLFGTNPFKSKENNELLVKAEQGDVQAQIKIGTKYETGNDIEQNVTEALKWYQKAADQGNSDAKVNIGNLYRIGSGVKQNDSDALSWYQQAANQGNANAQNELGVMYFNGTGIDKNNKEAASWFQKSADQGNSDAQVNLGVMYQKGDGTEKNDEQAVSLIRQSAEQGNNQAQLHLGEMYQNGVSVEKNTTEACSWYQKSAEQGNTDAQIGLAICYQSGDGIEKNDELADFWYKKAGIIKRKDNVNLINTTSYLSNFNRFITSVGTDEYVINEKIHIENFHRESGNWLQRSKLDASIEAHFKYHIKLATLKYYIDGDTLTFNIPNLYLSKLVETNSSTYSYKCSSHVLFKIPVPKDDHFPACKRANDDLNFQLTNELQKRGKTYKAIAYTDAANSLAHNFDSFAKNNDKGIYYKKIAVIFDDEIGKPRREFEINKSYCGDEPCKLEVPVGNGQILTIK